MIICKDCGHWAEDDLGTYCNNRHCPAYECDTPPEFGCVLAEIKPADPTLSSRKKFESERREAFRKP